MDHIIVLLLGGFVAGATCAGFVLMLRAMDRVVKEYRERINRERARSDNSEEG